MRLIPCPGCGRRTNLEATCPDCGRPAWIIEPVPAEVREHFRSTFDEAEYWAAFREAETSGCDDIEAILAELDVNSMNPLSESPCVRS